MVAAFPARSVLRLYSRPVRAVVTLSTLSGISAVRNRGRHARAFGRWPRALVRSFPFAGGVPSHPSVPGRGSFRPGASSGCVGIFPRSRSRPRHFALGLRRLMTSKVGVVCCGSFGLSVARMVSLSPGFRVRPRVARANNQLKKNDYDMNCIIRSNIAYMYVGELVCRMWARGPGMGRGPTIEVGCLSSYWSGVPGEGAIRGSPGWETIKFCFGAWPERSRRPSRRVQPRWDRPA